MKISNKQKEEIVFMEKYGNFESTEQEQEEYIRVSVHGNGSGCVGAMGIGNTNKLLIAKRSLDIMIKMWRRDLIDGLLGIEELYEDLGDTPYGKKLINSILKGLDFKKRNPDEGFAIIAISNALEQNKLKQL